MANQPNQIIKIHSISSKMKKDAYIIVSNYVSCHSKCNKKNHSMVKYWTIQQQEATSCFVYNPINLNNLRKLLQI